MRKKELAKRLKILEYIELKKRRPKPLRDPAEHRGTTQEFIDLSARRARELGGVRPIEYWGKQKYAQDMFSLATDERMLYWAWKSLKGETAGIDHVRPEKIASYVVYRQWLAKCELFGSKAPPFHKTTFPDLRDDALYVLSCLCSPNHMYKAIIVDFDGMRGLERFDRANEHLYKEYKAHIKRLRTATPGLLIFAPPEERTDLIAEAENKGMAPRAANTKLAIMLDTAKIETLLPKVGTDRDAVTTLAVVFGEGMSKTTCFWHKNQAKLFVADITPVKHLKRFLEEGEAALRESLNWMAMRWIRDLTHRIQINGKGYRPGPLRNIEIPKPDGGVRVLSLPSVIDRTVAKAALTILQPVMEKVFLPCSVGCRNDRDRFDALVALGNRYPNSPGKFILVADIKKAFDNVPHDKLLEVIRRYVPNSDMMTLLERFVRRAGFDNAGVGIAQGCPLSPLFLNMLLHERLDEPLAPFIKDQGLLYFRYVDDLCVFGLKSHTEGNAVISKIQELLRPVGLDLHTEAPKTQTVDLSSGELEYTVNLPDGEGAIEVAIPTQVDRYLGLGLRGGGSGQLEFFLPSTWKQRLREMYLRVEETIRRLGYADSEGAHKHILHATEAWIRAFAPALATIPKGATIAEIMDICRHISPHTGAISPGELSKAWGEAVDWWKRKLAE